MTEKEIIERLMLELDCCIEHFEPYAENESEIQQLEEVERVVNKLHNMGYKRFPEYRLQTDGDKRQIKHLTEF